MKEAYWGYWLIVLGIFIIVVLLLVQNFTSTNSQDFYLVKEIAEAAVEDSLDYGYYRSYGEAKINKEKFYESFIRRFSEEASLSTTYTIEFTEVFEAPPKIGVKVSSKANSFSIFGDSETFDIVHKLDAIMESKVTSSGYTAGPTVRSFRAGTAANVASDNFEPGYTTADDLKDKICYDNYGLDGEPRTRIVVDYCGYFNSDGLAAYETDGALPGVEYCIAHIVGDETYVVVAPKDNFTRAEYSLCD